MIHTHPEFIYELKIGIAALQRACYEVIEACVKIDYAVRLLDKNPGEASSGKQDGDVQYTHKEWGVVATVDKATGECKMENMKDGGPFTPTTKSRTTKGDPLAELAAQLSPQDREKLISAMEKK